jgi:hypothetical protein
MPGRNAGPDWSTLDRVSRRSLSGFNLIDEDLPTNPVSGLGVFVKQPAFDRHGVGG